MFGLLRFFFNWLRDFVLLVEKYFFGWWRNFCCQLRKSFLVDNFFSVEERFLSLQNLFLSAGNFIWSVEKIVSVGWFWYILRYSGPFSACRGPIQAVQSSKTAANRSQRAVRGPNLSCSMVLSRVHFYPATGILCAAVPEIHNSDPPALLCFAALDPNQALA